MNSSVRDQEREVIRDLFFISHARRFFRSEVIIRVLPVICYHVHNRIGCFHALSVAVRNQAG